MLLATDLDGTFLGGDISDRKKLYEGISRSNDITLVFVTGRGLQSVLSLYERDLLLPKADYIICDVGATIVDGKNLRPVETIQQNITAKWPGRMFILKELEKIDGLTLQNVPQHNRCSFFFNEHTDIKTLNNLATRLNVELILSAGKFADVLPPGVNKGSTFTALAKQLGLDENTILLAGDTFNDLALFNSGYKSVVVGNAEPGLTAATAGNSSIYQAKATGAGGILEAMQHFKVFQPWLQFF